MSPHGWFCSQVPQRMYLCLLKNSAILQANNIKDVPDWMVVKANPPKYVSMIT